MEIKHGASSWGPTGVHHGKVTLSLYVYRSDNHYLYCMPLIDFEVEQEVSSLMTTMLSLLHNITMEHASQVPLHALYSTEIV